jgi:hypothetical protein
MEYLDSEIIERVITQFSLQKDHSQWYAYFDTDLFREDYPEIEVIPGKQRGKCDCIFEIPQTSIIIDADGNIAYLCECCTETIITQRQIRRCDDCRARNLNGRSRCNECLSKRDHYFQQKDLENYVGEGFIVNPPMKTSSSFGLTRGEMKENVHKPYKPRDDFNHLVLMRQTPREIYERMGCGKSFLLTSLENLYAYKHDGFFQEDHPNIKVIPINSRKEKCSCVIAFPRNRIVIDIITLSVAYLCLSCIDKFIPHSQQITRCVECKKRWHRLDVCNDCIHIHEKRLRGLRRRMI